MISFLSLDGVYCDLSDIDDDEMNTILPNLTGMSCLGMNVTSQQQLMILFEKRIISFEFNEKRMAVQPVTFPNLQHLSYFLQNPNIQSTTAANIVKSTSNLKVAEFIDQIPANTRCDNKHWTALIDEVVSKHQGLNILRVDTDISNFI